jgi:hypothetical protein
MEDFPLWLKVLIWLVLGGTAIGVLVPILRWVLTGN